MTFKDLILKEISLGGWMEANLGRKALLSVGLPVVFSDTVMHLVETWVYL